MSYDLEILAKIENGQYIRIAEPRYSSPTYNLGKMFRIAMIGISTKALRTTSLMF